MPGHTKPIVTALGLMSGTSMDGIDLALIRSDGDRHLEFGPHAFVAYDDAFKSRIAAGLEDAKAITARFDRPGGLAALETELTMRHAVAVKELLATALGQWSRPDVVGFHGQTVLHRPKVGLTVQLGNGELLARETGVPVVFDMRANDMVHGGQGAPLVPAYHAALAAALPQRWRDRTPVVFVNIGGISNITFVPKAGDPIAFDTGPGNGLIDQWVSREGGVAFDESGAIAARGSVVQRVVDLYLQQPFFALPGPKSLDRNDFTIELANGLDLADGARTLARVSAAAVIKATEHLPERPKLWIVSGGGRKNAVMVADLKMFAAEIGGEVLVSDEAGFDGDFTEAEAWAYLAIRSLNGLPLTFPGTTGCHAPVSGGIHAALPTETQSPA